MKYCEQSHVFNSQNQLVNVLSFPSFHSSLVWSRWVKSVLIRFSATNIHARVVFTQVKLKQRLYLSPPGLHPHLLQRPLPTLSFFTAGQCYRALQSVLVCIRIFPAGFLIKNLIMASSKTQATKTSSCLKHLSIPSPPLRLPLVALPSSSVLSESCALT